MKSIISKLCLLLLMASCSKDDDSANTDEPVETKRYPKIVEILTPNTSGELTPMLKYTYGFNADKKLTSVEAEGFFGYENIYFTYGSNGMPKEIEVQNNQTTETFEFYYVENTLLGFSTNVQDYDIDYNSSNNTYTFIKNGCEDSFTINNMNDVRRYYSIAPTGSDTLMEMTFDTSKKGVFYNVDIPLNFFTALVSDASTLLFTSHVPLTEIHSDDGALDYQNEYDSDGFIIESYVMFGQDETITRFAYQEL